MLERSEFGFYTDGTRNKDFLGLVVEFHFFSRANYYPYPLVIVKQNAKETTKQKEPLQILHSKNHLWIVAFKVPVVIAIQKL